METCTIVIKVQYGDILRRFSAKVVDLSMGVLTEKILTLFKFGPGTEIMLTFTDEDGDSVDLVDDEDLSEMVKQSPNHPLRINVKLDGRTRFFLPPNPGSFVETYTDCSGTTHQPHVLMDGYGVDPLTGDLSIKANHRDSFLAVPNNYPSFKRARGSQMYRGPQVQPKLDSCFIRGRNRQYNIIVAPSSPFTKIWRMRNTGTVAWPQKTRLVWIEGYKLSNLLSVELKIPAIGLPVGQELDVAVDFISPELTGPYISYWRMISPSGEKFGERLWVLIQVTHPVKTVVVGRGNGASSSVLPCPTPSSHSYPLMELQSEKRELLLQTAAEVSMTQGIAEEQWKPKTWAGGEE